MARARFFARDFCSNSRQQSRRCRLEFISFFRAIGRAGASPKRSPSFMRRCSRQDFSPRSVWWRSCSISKGFCAKRSIGRLRITRFRTSSGALESSTRWHLSERACRSSSARRWRPEMMVVHLWANKSAERLALLGLLVASALGAAAGARFYPHYYIQLVPPLALLAAPLYAQLWCNRARPRYWFFRPAVTYTWLVITVLAFSISHWRFLAWHREPSETFTLPHREFYA